MINRDTIALDPTNRPKNGQQFMAKRLPYWKTREYRNFIDNGGTDKEYIAMLLKK